MKWIESRRGVWMLIGTLGFASGALVVSAGLLWGNRSGWELLIVTTTLVAILLGALCSWLLLTRVKRITFWKGALGGLVASVVIHPLTWYLVSLMLYLTGQQSSLGEPTLNPIEAVPASFIFSAFSLLLVGWLTIPLAALGFGVWAALYARSTRASE